MRKTQKESQIEKMVCRYASDKGWIVRKFSSPARRGVPDRIFMKAGRMFFIEFKAPGKTATRQQRMEHDKYQAELFSVYVIDNVEEGKALFDQ